MPSDMDVAIKLAARAERIRRVYEASKRVEGELTLAGNGVNSSEACLTLRWVMKVLDGEETQEYWSEDEDEDEEDA